MGGMLPKSGGTDPRFDNEGLTAQHVISWDIINVASKRTISGDVKSTGRPFFCDHTFGAVNYYLATDIYIKRQTNEFIVSSKH